MRALRSRYERCGVPHHIPQKVSACLRQAGCTRDLFYGEAAATRDLYGLGAGFLGFDPNLGA